MVSLGTTNLKRMENFSNGLQVVHLSMVVGLATAS
jgi:hypothetical protein